MEAHKTVGVENASLKTGKRLRMGKIFRDDGRTVVVAMDHGLFGPTSGIERPGETIKKLVKGGPDAILANLGIISKFADVLSAVSAVIWAIPSDATAPIYVKHAAKLGVDAVKVHMFGPLDLEKYSIFGPIAVECDKWGIPLVVEPVPMKEGKYVTNPEVVAKVARMGAEFGADFLKVVYTGSKDSFGEVVKVCPVPVTIMGGERMETEREVLEVVKASIDAGGAGVIFGRNIWQHRDPTAMVRGVSRIVHENAAVSQAIEELG